MKNYHSSYFVDVTVDEKTKTACLSDSMRSRFFVDLTVQSEYDGLKSWLKNVFVRGIPQTLTVFEYEKRGEGCDVENYVVRFLNMPQAES